MERYRRVNGSPGPKPVEKLNGVVPVYAIRWDIRENKGQEGSPSMSYGTNYMEAQVWHRPTAGECKELVLAWFNEEIDREILSGFVWRGHRVWLSSENQFNYKAAFDLAVMTGGATLPVVFKFGTAEAPEYHEFKTVEELKAFYTESMEYVTTVLKRGWAEKDAFDFTPYDPDYVPPVEKEPEEPEGGQEDTEEEPEGDEGKEVRHEG